MSVEETRKVMEAYWSGQGVAVVGEDAVYTLMDSGEEARGREAIAELLDTFYRQAFDARFEPISERVGDGFAVTEGYVVGTHVGEFAGIAASHKPMRVPLCVVYEVEGGYIQRAHIYFQVANLLRQIEA